MSLHLSKIIFKYWNYVIFTFCIRWGSPTGSENNLISYIGIGKFKFSGFCLASEERFSGIFYFLLILLIVKSRVKQYYKKSLGKELTYQNY